MKYEVTQAKNEKEVGVIAGLVIMITGIIRFSYNDPGIFSPGFWSDMSHWVDGFFLIVVGAFIMKESFQARQELLGDFIRIDLQGFEYKQLGDHFVVKREELKRIDILSKRIDWVANDFRSGSISLENYKGRSTRKEIREQFERLVASLNSD